MLNCIVQFTEHSGNKCNAKPSMSALARKLTSYLYPSIINNAYFKPNPKTPYYRIIKNHANDVADVVSQLIQPKEQTSIDLDAEVYNILHPSDKADHDYLLDLRCGDTERYTPVNVYIDYLKTPNIVMLTREDLESEIDNTPDMEFPDYICYEIINEFVKLLLENASDPRLQTNIPINQSIGYSIMSYNK